MTDIMYHNISKKKLFYLSEILCFTQSLQLLNQEAASWEIKVYGRQDTDNLSPKKQARGDAYFIIEILKKF